MTSETDRCRARLASYCTGDGVDLGCGGHLIVPSAIGIDLERPYTKIGESPIHLRGDARFLYWFNDQALDYVFSSHLLEDFPDTERVLREWLRCLKIGGTLILYLPNEQKYREFCSRTGQSHNSAHSVPEMSLEYISAIFEKIGGLEILHSNGSVEDYSFEVVARKIRAVDSEKDALVVQSMHAALERERRLVGSWDYYIGSKVMRLARATGLPRLLRLVRRKNS